MLLSGVSRSSTGMKKSLGISAEPILALRSIVVSDKRTIFFLLLFIFVMANCIRETYIIFYFLDILVIQWEKT